MACPHALIPTLLLCALSVCTSAWAQVEAGTPTLQACAAFTPEARAIEATVTAQAVSLSIGEPLEKMSNWMLPLPDQQHSPAHQAGTDDGCKLAIDNKGDQAVIFVPFEIQTLGGKISGRSVMLARLNLKGAQRYKPFVLEPHGDAGSYLNTSTLVGYLTNTKKLVIARSTGEIEVFGENDIVIPNGVTYGRSEGPLQGFSFGMDSAHDRRWGTCPYRETLLE